MRNKTTPKKAMEISSPEILESLPVEQQPYALSEGWKWTHIKDIAIVNPKNKIDDELDVSFVPMTMIDEGFSNRFQSAKKKWKEVKKGFTHFSEGDVAVAKISPCFQNRKSVLFSHLNNGYGAGTTELFVLKSNPKLLNNLFLLLYCKTEKFIQEGVQTYTGTVGQQRVSSDFIKNSLIPLPPLSEQKRIVARIEGLFDQLDRAATLASDAMAAFETRKASILHQAFKGELTREWRKKNNVDLANWRTKKLSEIANVVRGGSPRPAGDPKFYGGKIPFLKVADITNKTDPIFVCHSEYSIKEEGLKKTRLVEANTLLLTNSGATLGVPAICTFKTTFNDGIAAFLNLSEEIKFVFYYLSMLTPEFRSINKGAAQPNLNTELIGSYPIVLPTLPEQREIIRLLDGLLEKERQAKACVSEILERVDGIKKAILGKAFRGEL
jgi:type I restriction enzyme S subunit